MKKRPQLNLQFLGFPLLLGAVYTVQIYFPMLFDTCALWSNNPKWWQFFTNGFLSGNPIHLGVNMIVMWVVCSKFTAKLRLSFVFLYFTLFSAASSYLFYRFFMAPHMTLVGASSGAFSLMGFSTWMFRRGWVDLYGPKDFSARVPLFMAFMLVLECVVATYWIPVLAWRLHLIAFGLSISVAMTAHAAYAFVRWLIEEKYPSPPVNSVVISGLQILDSLKGTDAAPPRASCEK